jgi:hypothetical protein
LHPTAGDRHHLWNNLLGTNVIPHRMTDAELRDGLRSLMARVADDAVIADRIRTKLRQLGRTPMTFGLPPGRVLAYLIRFLLCGFLRGGPRRWYHFARSLVPAARNPRHVPFAVLNWVYGLAIQAFVRDHLRETARGRVAESPSACSMLKCPAA